MSDSGSGSEDGSSFDVEKYRVDYESEEHWSLRRVSQTFYFKIFPKLFLFLQDFMVAHQDKFSEDEVVCLARVFTNIEFLGCRYSNEVMLQIAELSTGIVEKYRRSRQDRLKRTFVNADQAAANKIQRK